MCVNVHGNKQESDTADTYAVERSVFEGNFGLAEVRQRGSTAHTSCDMFS